jgi:hypothetical protein
MIHTSNDIAMSRVLWSLEDLLELLPFTYHAAFSRLNAPLLYNAALIIAHAQLIRPDQVLIGRMITSVLRTVISQLEACHTPEILTNNLADATFGQLSTATLAECQRTRMSIALSNIIFQGTHAPLAPRSDEIAALPLDEIDAAFALGSPKNPYTRCANDNRAMDQLIRVFCERHGHPWWCACEGCG